MSLADPDHELVVSELGRAPTPVEVALFENLWSEHCAYRSSRSLLAAFESDSDRVVVGPGDDAAVISLTDDVYITLGIESHNHPSYVDPYDGAATGVGGIVRDTLSMGAYPIALADCLFFGPFEDEHSKYLFDGVVDGIADYGNAIGVPTVAGSVAFHPGYEGNPLVNVACVGLLAADRLVTAAATRAGNRLVLVGNATGRDGLGGASFASEDLADDAATADRPAVQVGDPYAEKLLIEANEALLDEGLVQAARDLGAAGLGGATSEMVAKGGFGADIHLDAVHQREPDMGPLAILLAESQERMCYEVHPDDVDAVLAIANRFDLGSSVVGTVTDSGRYVCRFESRVVVDVPATFLAEGAPLHDLPAETPPPPAVDRPSVPVETAIETVLASPNTASKAWVYRQYDHEVGNRTAVRPGDDAAVLAIREAGCALAITAGADPNWTATDPVGGGGAVALENATNLAAKGATPIAAVDCLNGGNPETPSVYHGFSGIVSGLADMCSQLSIPVVGGNVSLYNDSASGPIPPTPTVAMVGIRDDVDAPGLAAKGDGELVVIGDPVLDGGDARLGGSEYLAQFGGSDRFPELVDEPDVLLDAITSIANRPETLAVHDISHGGLVVTLAEMVTRNTGLSVRLPAGIDPLEALLHERPARVVVETTDAADVVASLESIAPAIVLGETDRSGRLAIAGEQFHWEIDVAGIRDRRSVIDRTLG